MRHGRLQASLRGRRAAMRPASPFGSSPMFTEEVAEENTASALPPGLTDMRVTPPADWLTWTPEWFERVLSVFT